MTRGKKLAVLTAVLVLLSAAAIVLTKLGAEPEDAVETYDSILSLDADTVTALSWTYGGETVFLNKTDSGWSCNDDAALPVNENTVSSMLSAVSEIIAYKTIDSPDDLSAYGLKEATCTVSITADSQYTLFLGDVSALDGELYVSVGDGKVYMTESTLLDCFSCTKYSLVQKESVPDLSSISSLSIAETGFEMLYLEDSEADSGEYAWYALSDGEYTALNDSAATLAGYYSAFAFGDCVCYSADESVLAEYGLDSPDATVELCYTDSDGEAAVFTLEISCLDGYYYVHLPESPIVYLLGDGVGEATLSAGIESMLA